MGERSVYNLAMTDAERGYVLPQSVVRHSEFHAPAMPTVESKWSRVFRSLVA